MSGDQILYVGDHVFTDVHLSKSILRWRTALILRELEHEIIESAAFCAGQARLLALMQQKRRLEFDYGQLKLLKLRLHRGYAAPQPLTYEQLEDSVKKTLGAMQELDRQIIPLVEASAKVAHPIWGLMMQAGNDKSLFARQVENYADIYTSRVSNFLFQSPFAYLRSPRGLLPHDIYER